MSSICTQLRSSGVSLLVATVGGRLPQVLHWGPELPLGPDDAETLLLASGWGAAASSLDAGLELGIIPEARFGWSGTPGLVGSREGRDWSPAWEVESVTLDGSVQTPGLTTCASGVVEYLARSPHSQLGLRIRVEMLPSGLVRCRATLTNAGEVPYEVQELTLRFPVPSGARDVLDFTGRWGNERVPQRSLLGTGAHRREGRRGRAGADSAYVLSLGEAGFTYEQGRCWAVHTAWSGNHLHVAERDSQGGQVIGGGELLLSGEVRLAEAESYETPWVFFNYADGLDEQAARFHEHLRSLPVHPSSPRPVSLNVWEAVYFHHDEQRLVDLAERAARLGVERFVLDDGWFGARRDDTAGLGDWVVSAEVWPAGLHPLVDSVKRLGMEFGLWFEPEMVNRDSDVARAHPEWIMQPGGRLPLEARHQQVLNLAIPEAFEHVLGQLDAIFGEYSIDYVKWDHNRDLVDAGTAPHGRAGVAEQTRAFYRLLDELRRRHPDIEFESCSSGGGRIDLEVMERVARVWVSDNIDPEERQRMLWWTGQLLPLELMGSHVASGTSHTTARWHDLDFRAATAVFGHLGIEWDLAQATEEELDRLGWWVRWYKERRGVLSTGRLVRATPTDDEVYLKGVVTPELAIYSLSALKVPATSNLGMLRFPGLDPAARYRVEVVDRPHLPDFLRAPWQTRPRPLELTGAQLAEVGLRAPAVRPSTAVLFELHRI